MMRCATERLPIFLVFVFLACSCATSAADPSQPKYGSSLVIVSNSETGGEISGARIFLIDNGGCEITVGHTDNYGQVYISRTMSHGEPLYVFAEKDPYYLTGVKWQQNATEYYILMSLRRIR